MKNHIKHKSHHKQKYKLIKGGGCDAPDVVSNYINPPHESVPANHLEGTDNIFSRAFFGPGHPITNIETPSCHSQVQSGGAGGAGAGFTIDLAEQIEKVPAIQRYDSNAPPVLLNGNLYLANSCESQCGGGEKISLYKVKKMTAKKSMTKSKGKNHPKKKSGHKKSGSTKKTKKQSQSRRKHMGGGEGEIGNFSPDMLTRDFSGKQPEWNVNTI
jgi:hypothetical protein